MALLMVTEFESFTVFKRDHNRCGSKATMSESLDQNPASGRELVCQDVHVNQADVSENPWWHSASDDLDLPEPLPSVVILSPDYNAGMDAGLPLWAEGSGQISWRSTKFSPELLERLANWQDDFDSNYRWDKGWSSEPALTRWAQEATDLAADVRRELSARTRLVVHLWPLDGTQLDFGPGSVTTEQSPDAEAPE
jgi:hypothetical protein